MTPSIGKLGSLRDRKGQVSPAQILPLVVVPFGIILMLIIFGAMDTTFRENSLFQGTSSNETLVSASVTSSPQTAVTDLKFVDVGTETIMLVNGTRQHATLSENGTAGCGAANCYTIEKIAAEGTNRDNYNVTMWLNSTDTESQDNTRINATYDHFDDGSSAEDSFTKTLDNSYSGFDLGSIIPIVIAGVVILGVVIGGVAFIRR